MIRLSKSVVGEQEAAAVSKVILEDGYLGMGKEVDAFEQDIAAYIGIEREQVVCVNSGTAALHIALMALGQQPGSEVLVPSFTYVASFQAITAAGWVPVSCEIDPGTWTIDLSDAATRITPRTKAIMPVHFASNLADLENIYKFAQQHQLRIVEDAAHAFGCTYQDKKIGSFGDVVCFSFDGIKNITSGEGGAIVTKDPAVLNYVKDARLLGVIKDTDMRYQGKRSWDFDVKDQGYRYHMSNLFAAIGRVQLKRLVSEFGPKRRQLLAAYRNALGNVNGISLQQLNSQADIIPHIFPVRIHNGKRDQVKQVLNDNNVQTGIHYKPNHLLSLFAKEGVNLPVTEEVYTEILTLPMHPDMKEEDVIYICTLIKQNL